jgi:hypothetical protein
MCSLDLFLLLFGVVFVGRNYTYKKDCMQATGLEVYDYSTTSFTRFCHALNLHACSRGAHTMGDMSNVLYASSLSR